MDSEEPETSLDVSTRSNGKSQLSKVDWIFLWILLLILSLSILARGNPYYFEPGRDSGFFMFAGKELLRGKTLYTQIWDSKGPMIFFINALGFWLGSGSRWGLWFLELFFLIIVLGLAYSILNKHWDHRAALLGTVAGAFSLKQIFGVGNTVEEYSLLCSFVALFFYLQGLKKKDHRPEDLIIGGSLMASFHLRANNIGVEIIIILLIIYFTWKEKGFLPSLTRIGWIILGTIFINLPILLYFYLHGTLYRMVEASIFYNFFYSQEYRSSSLIYHVINDSFLMGIKYFKGWSYVFGLGYTACIFYAIKGAREHKSDPLTILTLMLLPLEVALSAISGRGYQHYFINWIPAIVLSYGFFFEFAKEYLLSKDLIRLLNTKAKLCATCFVLVFTITSQWGNLLLPVKVLYKSIINPGLQMEYKSRTASYIEENTNVDDKVLVIGGQAGINLMSDRASMDGSLFYPLINNSSIGMKLQKEYLENLKTQKPVMIIDGFAIYPWILPAVNPEYRAQQEIATSLAQNTNETLNYIWENYYLVHEVEDYSIYRIKK